MVAVLGGLADVERDLIRTRTSEGRVRAKARGVRLGRKLKLTLQQRGEALARRAAGHKSYFGTAISWKTCSSPSSANA